MQDDYMYCDNMIDLARALGREARRRGAGIDRNPYPTKGKRSSYWGWWRDGWKRQDEEIEQRRTPSRALVVKPEQPKQPRQPRQRNPRKRVLTPRDPNYCLRSKPDA